jgi:hypothetical protein
LNGGTPACDNASRGDTRCRLRSAVSIIWVAVANFRSVDDICGNNPNGFSPDVISRSR